MLIKNNIIKMIPVLVILVIVIVLLVVSKKNTNNLPNNYLNDFADIGFAKTGNFTVEDFMRIIELAASKGEWIETQNGFYVKLTDQSGAEIWGQANKRKELIGGHPHFVGKSRNVFEFRPFFGSKYSELDGSIYSHIHVNETEIDYNLLFGVPDFYLNNKFKEGDLITVQITAFAKNDIEIYDNYEEYLKIKKDGVLAKEAFIPATAFSQQGLEKESAPEAAFSGTIKEVEELTNTLTGDKFFHLLVKTLSAEFDVVVASDVLEKIPQNGDFIVGVFSLSGKII